MVQRNYRSGYPQRGNENPTSVFKNISSFPYPILRTKHAAAAMQATFLTSRTTGPPPRMVRFPRIRITAQSLATVTADSLPPSILKLKEYNSTKTDAKSQGALQVMFYGVGLSEDNFSRPQMEISPMLYMGIGTFGFGFNTLGVSYGISRWTRGMPYSLHFGDLIEDTTIGNLATAMRRVGLRCLRVMLTSASEIVVQVLLKVLQFAVKVAAKLAAKKFEKSQLNPFTELVMKKMVNSLALGDIRFVKWFHIKPVKHVNHSWLLKAAAYIVKAVADLVEGYMAKLVTKHIAQLVTPPSAYLVEWVVAYCMECLLAKMLESWIGFDDDLRYPSRHFAFNLSLDLAIWFWTFGSPDGTVPLWQFVVCIVFQLILMLTPMAGVELCLLRGRIIARSLLDFIDEDA